MEKTIHSGGKDIPRLVRDVSKRNLRKVFKMKSNWNRAEIFAFVLFGVAVAVILRWLWSGVFLAEFHSDTADTLFAAAAVFDAGSIASPTYHHSYFLPFGGQLLVLPFLSAFGIGISALRCGMTVFLLCFVFATYALFRSLKWSRAACWLSSALVLVVASATPKMREIYFGHVLYYSLGTLFFFLGLVFSPELSGETETTRHARIRKVFFALCMAWAASCGKPLLLYAIIPVLGGWILVRSGEDRPFSLSRDRRALCPGILGAGIGLAAFSILYIGIPPTEYGDAYSVFSLPELWLTNLKALPAQWIALICVGSWNQIPIVSGRGFFMVGGIAMAIVFAIAPVVALFRVRSFSFRERTLLAGHWTLTIEVLFFWVFGTISDANWRLSPVMLSSVAVTICLVKHALRDEIPLFRRLAVAGVLLLSAEGASILFRTSTLPCNWHTWRGKQTLVSVLEDIDVHDGYCTDFWFSNATTAITGNRFRLRQVVFGGGGWRPRLYLADGRWFRPDSSRTKTVFVCLPNEESLAPAKGRVDRFECEQFDFRNNRLQKLIVFVYDDDCLNPTVRKKDNP